MLFNKKDSIEMEELAAILANCTLHMDYPSKKFQDACYDAVREVANAKTEEEKDKIRDDINETRHAYIMGKVKYICISIGGERFYKSVLDEIMKQMEASGFSPN